MGEKAMEKAGNTALSQNGYGPRPISASFWAEWWACSSALAAATPRSVRACARFSRARRCHAPSSRARVAPRRLAAWRRTAQQGAGGNRPRGRAAGRRRAAAGSMADPPRHVSPAPQSGRSGADRRWRRSTPSGGRSDPARPPEAKWAFLLLLLLLPPLFLPLPPSKIVPWTSPRPRSDHHFEVDPAVATRAPQQTKKCGKRLILPRSS